MTYSKESHSTSAYTRFVGREIVESHQPPHPARGTCEKKGIITSVTESEAPYKQGTWIKFEGNSGVLFLAYKDILVTRPTNFPKEGSEELLPKGLLDTDPNLLPNRVFVLP